MKVTVVGGGSTYTPELVDGIARLQHQFDVAELVLTDPAEQRLALVAGVSQRIFARYGYSGQISFTTDLDRAVADAAIVLLQLRVGGQAARAVDESLPLRCGCVGQETTGTGGLAKALRTVPVILEIAERVSRLAAKDALDHVGLNHLTWTRRVLVDEQDRLPELLATSAEALAGRSGLPAELLRRLGVWPSYYLRYFYEHDHVVEQQRSKPSRAQEVAEIESQLLEIYADPAVDEKPALLQQRGGAYYSEAAVDLMASLITDRGDVQVVNLRNHGTLAFLDDQAVIEVPAQVNAQGPQPQTLRPVDPLLAGLIAHVSAYEELALDAAIRGGRERVFRALLAHPLIGQHDIADKLTDLLIAANRDHLRWAA